MTGTGIGRDLVEIASLFIAVGLVSMLVLHSSQTAQVIQAGSSAFAGTLAVATGQNSGLGLSFQ